MPGAGVASDGAAGEFFPADVVAEGDLVGEAMGVMLTEHDAGEDEASDYQPPFRGRAAVELIPVDPAVAYDVQEKCFGTADFVHAGLFVSLGIEPIHDPFG